MYRYHHFLLVVLLLVSCGNQPAGGLHNGDIVFQTSHSSQSQAIQLATHSKYSHVGIVFLKGGKPYVFEAIGPVQYTPLQQWVARGVGGHYVVKRLRNADQLMTTQTIARLKSIAAGFQGKPYDFAFGWSDDHIYCSELVWKIYDRGIGIQIGQLRKLKEFDLSNDAVKRKLRERYGNDIPYDESVISPADMFASKLLNTVYEK